MLCNFFDFDTAFKVDELTKLQQPSLVITLNIPKFDRRIPVLALSCTYEVISGEYLKGEFVLRHFIKKVGSLA